MAWCERNGVQYILGMAKNSRLKAAVAGKMEEARRLYEETGKPARVFHDFGYRTVKSWSRERRVIGKAEYLAKGANPRFVVTSYRADDYDARTLYEEEYCARGEMENRIKEQQLYLFSDRTSTSWFHSNQLRLYLSAMAYILIQVLRHFGLRGTGMAEAQCHTIRTKLLKIGALVRISVRRVVVAMAGGYPYQRIFAAVYSNLRRLRPMTC